MHSQAYMTTLAGRWSGQKVMSTHICPRALFLRACFLKGLSVGVLLHEVANGQAQAYCQIYAG